MGGEAHVLATNFETFADDVINESTQEKSDEEEKILRDEVLNSTLVNPEEFSQKVVMEWVVNSSNYHKVLICEGMR